MVIVFDELIVIYNDENYYLCSFSVEEEDFIGIQRRSFADKTSKIENRIVLSPWDTEAWNQLIVEAQLKDIRVARDIYEKFLRQFPTAVRLQ